MQHLFFNNSKKILGMKLHKIMYQNLKIYSIIHILLQKHNTQLRLS